MSEPLSDEELATYRGMTWGPYDTSRLFATIDYLTAERYGWIENARIWSRKNGELVAERDRESAWADAEGSEPCQDCRKFNGLIWSSPQPLWMELNGRYGGLICPRCFDAKAEAAGIRLVWTPVVTCRDHVATTNHWTDPVRDRLLMGEPDPHYHDDERAQVPQGHWGEIAKALGWDYETPYPDENRSDRMAGVAYRDSGVNADAIAALPEEET
jgi:hypothetical protein